MPYKKLVGPCGVVGCGRQIDSNYLCTKHYQMNYLHGRTYKVNTGTKRSHPLYIMWFGRKSEGRLCKEWHEDFWAFAKCIGEKKAGDFLLERPDPSKPYSPENWHWRPHQKRMPGETKKEWVARQWAHSPYSQPQAERLRSLKRRFNLTPEKYVEMKEKQGNTCAICKQPEKAISHKSGAIKNLAVDHDHKTGAVRGLLCWRCNAAIGKLNDDWRLVQDAANYLRYHRSLFDTPEPA